MGGGVDFSEILTSKKKKRGRGWVGLVIFMVMSNFVKRKRGRMANPLPGSDAYVTNYKVLDVLFGVCFISE